MLKELLKFVLVVALVVAGVALVLRYAFCDEIAITDDRMAPTLLAGERALLWRDTILDVGDVVVCQNPRNANEYVIGRVIGLEGARIASERGALTVNGHTFDTQWKTAYRFRASTASHDVEVRWGKRTVNGSDHAFQRRTGFEFNLREVRVGPGQAFLLADYDGLLGMDSQTFGPVTTSTCLGQIILRLAPGTVHPPGDEPLDHAYLDIIR